MAEGKSTGIPIFFPAARKQKLKHGHFVDEVGLELRPRYGKIMAMKLVSSFTLTSEILGTS